MISAETIALAREWTPQLLVAAGQTLRMTFFAYILGLVAGLLLAFGEMARARWLSVPCRVYIEFVRGTPTLVQLFLIYFGLASAGLVVPGFLAAVTALGLHYAAYMAEIYRSGIAAIDRGQSEAAKAIGMTAGETMRYIVLPQAVRVILPPMANSVISLLKDTSVASLIAAPELMMRADDITSEYYMPMQVYLITGAMYFIMAFPLSLGVRWLERVARYEGRVQVNRS
ncbi:amino acid ABC transporter permease [Agrobacterium rhizogenes]|nr:amino acid ABC transporter permease [Rhizobium rhizogenes]NTH62055.1 amino acid ABC transporter permease [Rhizobium rhizogenes]NTH93681.1 amino acid ABC transporter permease [Rhizobium rhizogenes]